MADFSSKIKQLYRNGDLLVRLIMINVFVFVVCVLFALLDLFFGLNLKFLITFLEVPGDWSNYLTQPWSILSYMFLHQDIWHILFNMLWLYWFGQLFLQVFHPRQLVLVYLLSGITGGACYLLAYNIIPSLAAGAPWAYLLGASAAVFGIVAATAVAMPNTSMYLMFLGAIKLKYIALAAIIISSINMTGSNAGGNIAHFGGALFGFIFATAGAKGKDLTKPFGRIMDILTNLFRPRPRMKVQKGGGRTVDMKYNAQRAANEEEIDRILDKIKRTGYNGLTPDEKQKLFNVGKK